MNLAPPTSQKADTRPISFVLVDQTQATDTISPNRTVTLFIRPEELTRSDPSRINTQQTLGNAAWSDNFGPGLQTISISGHTGWHRSTDNLDGEARFRALKSQVFDDWHKRKKDAVRAGRNPADIKLVFADSLDRFAAVVSPMNFTLRRSRARPLLLQYQIALTVIDQNIDQQSAQEPSRSAESLAELQQSGLESMAASIVEIAEYAKDIQNYVDRAIAAPVARFMNQTGTLYRSVQNAIRAGDGIAEALISVARMTSQAGLNLFRTAAAVINLPSHARARLMQVAGAYTNIFCVLNNAVGQQLFYPDYSPLFGSSNCSSTSGGRPPSPLSGVNPFYYITPTETRPPVQMTTIAKQNLQMLATNDAVQSPLDSAQLGAAVSLIVEGITIT